MKPQIEVDKKSVSIYFNRNLSGIPDVKIETTKPDVVAEKLRLYGK